MYNHNRPPTPYKSAEMEDFAPTEEEMFNYDEPAAVDEMDTEQALQYIDAFDNLTQLHLLKKEINHFIIHECVPNEGWYEERYKHIQTYSQLNWLDMAERFYGKDSYIHDTSLLIIRICEEIMDSFSVRPNFDLDVYWRLLHEISNIWDYYKETYMGEEQDTDVVDLIEGLTHMMG